ncbi:metal-dependent membrane protease [Secundilactobacillus oryzae JCM 18671]|uniref:Metal-dependent membrane protease n=1 Tax=Secundilactobacillus oryzae JCM 18671 TaxID=1291743 RepID=A0A081BG72_9LACO|nr:type II CAAX endopeptidase family protein [Secundilactobacillus oryzae]GAK47040.1 metal-dependent membrane protease [Secundilactobacillus oryzae JCM 18671]
MDERTQLTSTTPKFNRYLWFASLFVLIQFVQVPVILFKLIPQNNIGLRLVNAVAYIGAFALVIWLAYFLLKRLPNRTYFTKLTMKQWGLTLIGLVAFFAAEMVLSTLNAAIDGQTQTANNEVIQNLMSADKWSLYLMVISGIFLSPVLEEMVFRGYLMNAFFKPESIWLPVIVSGVIFSLGHGSTTIMSFLIYATMGAILAFVYRRTGSLRASIAIHMINNAFAMLALLASILVTK